MFPIHKTDTYILGGHTHTGRKVLLRTDARGRETSFAKPIPLK